VPVCVCVWYARNVKWVNRTCTVLCSVETHRINLSLRTTWWLTTAVLLMRRPSCRSVISTWRPAHRQSHTSRYCHLLLYVKYFSHTYDDGNLCCILFDSNSVLDWSHLCRKCNCQTICCVLYFMYFYNVLLIHALLKMSSISCIFTWHIWLSWHITEMYRYILQCCATSFFSFLRLNSCVTVIVQDIQLLLVSSVIV